MTRTYVHGYDPRENLRLQDQAATLVDLLHADTAYPAGSRVLEAGCGVGAQTIILAARLYARRGTMLGLAQLGDGLVGSILRADPDVARLLRIGVHTAPGVS